MEQKMKKIGTEMNLLMGVTMSFCLSLVGMITSGHFTLPGWLISFLVSTVIALIIGFAVPWRKLAEGAVKKSGMKPGAIGARCLESLISDLVYTPVIVLIMILLAWRQATSHGAQIPFLPMFLHALIISLVVGFVLIFIITPIYMKLVFKRNGVQPGGRPQR